MSEIIKGIEKNIEILEEKEVDVQELKHIMIDIYKAMIDMIEMHIENADGFQKAIDKVTKLRKDTKLDPRQDYVT